MQDELIQKQNNLFPNVVFQGLRQGLISSPVKGREGKEKWIEVGQVGSQLGKIKSNVGFSFSQSRIQNLGNFQPS